MSEVAAAVDWDTDPSGLDCVSADLRAMRRAAGEPSFAAIGRRVAALRAERGVPEHERRMPRSTLYDCFRDGRRRIDLEAVAEIAAALGLPDRLRPRWAERARAAQAAADGAAVALARTEVPAPVPYFAGRDDDLARITAALADPEGMVWVSGMAGSGKTQVALRAVQRLTERGVGAVFLDLRGRHAESPPVAAPAAQRAVLRELGVPAPGGDDDRTELLADKLRSAGRVLVLDDATDAAHVTAVLGERLAGRVLVTSRARPPGDDTRWTAVTVSGMDAAETAAVLRHLAGGTAPLEIDAESAARLSVIAGGLPLAVTLVGGRLATHPGWTLAEHVDLMEQRIAAAHLDDELRVTLGISYAGLDAAAGRVLRLFADLPVAELSPDLTAAALRIDLGAAGELLDQLTDSGLAVPRGRGRIALHSLVRAFARARADETDSPRTREGSFRNVTLHAAEQVWRAYASIARSMDDEPRRTTFPYPDDDWRPEAARAWLADHLPAVLGLAHAAPERGHPELLLRISEGLSWWMNVAGHHGQALHLHEAAADVATRVGDADALAMASLDAGQLLVYRDRPDDALVHFHRATRLISSSEELSDPGLLGVLLNMSALVELRKGNPSGAVEALRRAVEIHESRGEGPRLMSALVNLGIALYTAGRFEEEETVLDEGLRLAEDRGNTMFIANFLVNRAQLFLATGRAPAALGDAEKGIAHAADLAAPYLLAAGHSAVAEALLRTGDLAGARDRASTALSLARELGNEVTTAEQLLVMASVHTAGGEHGAARELLDEATALLTPDRDHALRGRIWRMRAELATDHAERERWLSRALRQFEAAGAFQAAELRQLLAS